jgi:hypothetical protein
MPYCQLVMQNLNMLSAPPELTFKHTRLKLKVSTVC